MRVPEKIRAGFFGLALVLLSLVAWCMPAQAEDVVLDGVLVTVNGQIITKFEHDERMLPVYEKTRGHRLSADDIAQVDKLSRQFLDQMIDDILILQDAERYKLKINDAEVQEQTKEFLAKRKMSEDEFKKQLALQRMTRAEFVRNMRRDMIKHRLIGGVVTNKIAVTDSEVEQRYNERKAEFTKESMVQLALIIVPAGMSPVELKAQIESGQISFADAANKYSQGPGVGSGGGIGYIAWKDLAPEWSAALSGLKPGQVAQPVRVQDQDGLLEVVALTQGEELPLSAVREQIYQSLHDAKFEKVFQDYMQKLRQKAVIEYRNL